MTFRDDIEATAFLTTARAYALEHMKRAMECGDALVELGVYGMQLRRWRACVADAAEAQAFLDRNKVKEAA